VDLISEDLLSRYKCSKQNLKIHSQKKNTTKAEGKEEKYNRNARKRQLQRVGVLNSWPYYYPDFL
jgi:hypothetical protein